jgi:hypothetical protein
MSDPDWEALLLDAANKLQIARLNDMSARDLAKRRARRAITEGGFSESRTAKLLGVDRMTIRNWVGKR